MGHEIEVEISEERSVEEGDTVVFTGQENRTEAEVVTAYDDGSFMLEWTQNGEERGQIARPKVFGRSAFVHHEPADGR